VLELTFPVSSPHPLSSVDAFCQTLVDTLEGTPGLRYIWSTFKPLLQGKVLYAPDTPAARLLVKEVGLEKKKKHLYMYPCTHAEVYEFVFLFEFVIVVCVYYYYYYSSILFAQDNVHMSNCLMGQCF